MRPRGARSVPAPNPTHKVPIPHGKPAPQVLTETPRGMERDGLISRKPYPNVPPRAEYQLAEMGASAVAASLSGPLKTLCRWAEAHAEERRQEKR